MVRLDAGARRVQWPAGGRQDQLLSRAVRSEPRPRQQGSLANARNKEGRQRRLVDEHLRAGRSVVVDNTNRTLVEREPLIAIARAAGAVVTSYAFVTTVEDAIRRNAGREGRARIPDVGIRVTAQRLVPPTDDEDFDRRFEVRLTDAGFVVVATLLACASATR
jgi:predicted kinase